MSELLKYLFPLMTSFIICAMLIPVWIAVCNKRKLFDYPDGRKIHAPRIPSMGGLAIYAGIFISYFLFGSKQGLQQMGFLLSASMLLFFTGFFDDLLDLSPVKKLFLQVSAASLLIAGGTMIHGLGGIAGIDAMPLYLKITVTVLFVVTITNAYNLVDGIDGLAASIGIICAATFATVFFNFGMNDDFILCLCIVGSLAGFLVFNFYPAKLFMGDTGSLLLGFLFAALSINLMNAGDVSAERISPHFIASVLIIPAYDVLRIIVVRVIAGKPPLRADRNHLHHMVLGHGFTHRGATLVLCLYNIFFIGVNYLLRDFNINHSFIITLCLAMLLMNSTVMSHLSALHKKIFGAVRHGLRQRA